MLLILARIPIRTMVDSVGEAMDIGHSILIGQVNNLFISETKPMKRNCFWKEMGQGGAKVAILSFVRELYRERIGVFKGGKYQSLLENTRAGLY